MKLQVPFVQLPILFDAEALRHEVDAIEERHWRGRSQANDGNSALTLITAGGDPDNDDLSGVMAPTPFLERCPYVMQVLESLGITCGRARLMRLNGQAEVRAHVDINYYWRERMRVHVPIVTTPSVRFRCGEGETHMGTGECWIFDTWRRHRVVNGGGEQRTHLVVDTVGGDRFFDLMAAGRAHGQPDAPGWAPTLLAPRADARPQLAFERVNAPVVMSPWEIRAHVAFLLGEAVPTPALGPIQQAMLAFARRWQAVWANHGDTADGWPAYRALLAEVTATLAGLGVDGIGLRNEVGLRDALDAHVLGVALGSAASGRADAQQDRHGEDGIHAGAIGVPEPAQPAAPTAPATAFDRPVFIVSPPRSGSTLLFETLAKAPGVVTIGDESHALIEGVRGLSPADRDHADNRLDASDANDAVAAHLRGRFQTALRDREGRPPGDAAVRLLEKTPKNALRIPFLARVFPDARFIYLHRDPRHVLASMIEGWRSGRFRTYPALPGWRGDPWSFLLTPGWRDLVDQPPATVVGAQWAAATSAILDDLAALGPERWTPVDYDRFIAAPDAEAQRLATWAGWGWDTTLGAALPLSRYTLTPPDPEKWRRHQAAVEAALAPRDDLVARARAAAGL